MHEAQRKIGDVVEFSKDAYETLVDADALMLVTEWTEFRFPNWDVVKKLMKHNVIFDGRNIFDYKEMKNNGFEYYCLGIKKN